MASSKNNGMRERKTLVQVHGHHQADEAEVRQAVENALANLTTLLQTDQMDFDGPDHIARVAEHMIKASMDRMGIEDVVGLTVTCVG